MDKKKLKNILTKQKMWLDGDKDGIRANLHNADLHNADLHNADLRGFHRIGEVYKIEKEKI